MPKAAVRGTARAARAAVLSCPKRPVSASHVRQVYTSAVRPQRLQMVVQGNRSFLR